MAKRFVLIAVLMTLGLLVAACAPAAAPPAPAGEKPAGAPRIANAITPADELPPQSGGTFLLGGNYDWPHHDPHQTLTAAMHGVNGLIYGYLTRYETTLDPTVGFKVVGHLAESWEQPNETTYIFKLRKGVKWHNIPPVNGREVIADDVVYSINRIKTPGWISAPLMVDVEKVEALDRYTVKFTLKGPSAPFMLFLANGYTKMVAKEAVEAGKGGDLKNGPNIGFGPFYVGPDDIRSKVGTTLRKFPDYFERDAQGNQLPYLDIIEAPIVPDSATQFAAMRTARFFSRGCSPEECNQLKKQHPQIVYKDTKSYSSTQIGLKTDRPPFSDLRVRKAVSLALDRATMYETINLRPYEQGWFNLSFVVPSDDWILPQEEFEKAWRHDPEEGRKLLAEAGYPNGFDLELTCANYSASAITTCEFEIDSLSKVGIRAKMKIVDQPTYSAHVFAGDGNFQMYSGPQGTFLDPDQWLSGYYHTNGPRNVNKINDPKLDQMIEAQRKELDLAKRKVLVQEIQRYLLGQYYHLHSRSSFGTTAYWPWVGGNWNSPVADYPTSRGRWYTWINQDLYQQHKP